jgi:hypothetical protein
MKLPLICEITMQLPLQLKIAGNALTPMAIDKTVFPDAVLVSRGDTISVITTKGGFASPLIPREPLEACRSTNQFPDEVLTEISQVLEFG